MAIHCTPTRTNPTLHLWHLISSQQAALQNKNILNCIYKPAVARFEKARCAVLFAFMNCTRYVEMKGIGDSRSRLLRPERCLSMTPSMMKRMCYALYMHYIVINNFTKQKSIKSATHLQVMSYLHKGTSI